MKILLSHTMTRLLLGLGVLVALIGMLAVGAELGLFDGRYEKPAGEVFGSKRGALIKTGFVFKDGIYVDVPYIVSRRAVDIYINETKIDTLGPWPPADYDDKKPEMPAGLTKNSTFKDLEIPGRPSDSLDRQMVRWLKRHYDGDKARQLIVEYYRSLPFVKEVKLRENMENVIVVSTWYSKRDIVFNFGGPIYKPPTPDAAQKELERICTRWEKRLTNGECIFLFSSGGELAFGSRKAAIDLAAIVQTLRSDRPKKEKIKKLQNLGLLPPEVPKSWEVLVTGFSASPQLDERVKQLRLPAIDSSNTRGDRAGEASARGTAAVGSRALANTGCEPEHDCPGVCRIGARRHFEHAARLRGLRGQSRQRVVAQGASRTASGGGRSTAYGSRVLAVYRRRGFSIDPRTRQAIPVARRQMRSRLEIC